MFELRLSLLQESGDPLTHVGARKYGSAGLERGSQFGAHLVPRSPIDALLDRLYRSGRSRSPFARAGDCPLQTSRRLGEFIDKSDLVSTSGTDGIAVEQQRDRRARVDQTRQPCHSSASGYGTEMYLGESDPAVLAHDAVVAAQGKLRPSSQS